MLHAALAVVLLALAPDPDPATLTVRNATGMHLIFLYGAACGENEGSDWSEMDEWAIDYLGAEILEPEQTIDLDLVTGCFVFNPVWDDGTSLTEQVQIEGDQELSLTLG